MTFHSLNFADFLSHFCILQKKWGIFISVEPQADIPNLPSEIKKAIPILTEDQIFELIVQECAFLLFDTEGEMDYAYSHIVGKDGPTANNPYSEDLVRVYALTCDNSGQILTENC